MANDGDDGAALEDVDHALVLRARRGDRLAFDGVVERHGRQILTYLRRLAPRPGDAEDLFQETFLRAWKALSSLSDPERLRAWLLTIATNAARRAFADQSRARRLEDVDAKTIAEPASDAAPALDDLVAGERARAVRAAIARLPARQRAVLTLRIEIDLPFAEIARVIGIAEDNARANHYQAMKALERMLRADVVSAEDRR